MYCFEKIVENMVLSHIHLAVYFWNRLSRRKQSCLLKVEIIIIVMSDQNMFSYIVEGVLLTSVSTFGLVGNILSIVVLTRSINSGSDNSGLGHGRNQGFNKWVH